MSSDILKGSELADINSIEKTMSKVRDEIKLTTKDMDDLIKKQAEVKKGSKGTKSTNDKNAVTGESVKNAKALNEAEKQLITNTKTLNSLDEQKRKVKALANQSIDAQSKSLQKLKIAQQRANKESKLTAQYQLAERNSYEKLSLATKIYGERRKKLNMATSEGQKLDKKYLKIINANNKAMAKGRSVEGARIGNIGNYKSALEGLQGSFSKLAPSLTNSVGALGMLNKAFMVLLMNPIILVLAGIVAAVVTLVNAFKRSQEGVEAFATAGAVLSTVFETIMDVLTMLSKYIVKAFKDPKQMILDLGSAIKTNLTNRITGLIELFSSLATIGASAFTILKEKIKGVFGAQDTAALEKAFKSLENGAKKSGMALFKAATGVDKTQLEKLGKAFNGVTNKIKSNIEASKILTTQQFKLDKAINDSTVALALNNTEVKKQRTIGVDQNKIIDARIIAYKKANAIEAESAKIQRDLQMSRIAQTLGITDEAKAREKVNAIIKDGKKLTLEEIGLHESTEEDRGKAMKQIADYINLQASQFQSQQRNISALSGLEKQKATMLEKARNNEIEATEKMMDEEASAIINANSEALNKRFAKAKEYYSKQFDLTKDLSKEELTDLVEKLNKELGLEKLTAEQKEKIAEDLTKAQKEQNNNRIANEEAMWDKLKSMSVDTAKDIAGSLFEISSNKIEAEVEQNNERRNKELEDLETEYEEDVSRAGDNNLLKLQLSKTYETEQEKINEKADKKNRTLKRKQAENAKKEAYFNAAMNAAQAITGIWAVWSENPIVAAILTGLAVAATSVQIAAINSRPLPAYEKGGEVKESGAIQVSEKGQESYFDKKTKNFKMLPKKHSVISGMKGNTIFTAQETRSILNGSANANMLSVVNASNPNESNNIALENEVKGLRGDVANLTSVMRHKKTVRIEQTSTRRLKQMQNSREIFG